MPYCANCGAGVGQKDRFCMACGTRVGPSRPSEPSYATSAGTAAPPERGAPPVGQRTSSPVAAPLGAIPVAQRIWLALPVLLGSVLVIAGAFLPAVRAESGETRSAVGHGGSSLVAVGIVTLVESVLFLATGFPGGFRQKRRWGDRTAPLWGGASLGIAAFGTWFSIRDKVGTQGLLGGSGVTWDVGLFLSAMGALVIAVVGICQLLVVPAGPKRGRRSRGRPRTP